MTRLVIKAVDKYGNRLPHADTIVRFEIEGPGELIGDNPLVLIGGQAALYVKAGKQAGVITVRASAKRLPLVEVRITVGEDFAARPSKDRAEEFKPAEAG